MNKEEYFIKQFSGNKVIGDDGAFIDGFVYSMDAFFENVHFKKEWMSLKQIAYKSMIVNISDAIVMNATPLYALLSVDVVCFWAKTLLEIVSVTKLMELIICFISRFYCLLIVICYLSILIDVLFRSGWRFHIQLFFSSFC